MILDLFRIELSKSFVRMLLLLFSFSSVIEGIDSWTGTAGVSQWRLVCGSFEHGEVCELQGSDV